MPGHAGRVGGLGHGHGLQRGGLRGAEAGALPGFFFFGGVTVKTSF